MNVIPFKAEHLERIANGDLVKYLEPSKSNALEGGLAFTCMAGETILLCGGAIEVWTGRYIAWAYVAPDACHYWKSLHKAAKNFLKTLNAQRVEAEVDADFIGGRKWVERLGFTLETDRAKSFFQDGRDAALFARVKV